MTRRGHRPVSTAPRPIRVAAEPALLGAPSWSSLLERYARATGITVALAGRDGALRSSPYAFSPLCSALVEAGAWRDGGGGATSAERAAHQAIETKEFVFDTAFDVLSVFAAPLMLGDEVHGAVVGGYVFESFLDPVAADRLARDLGTTFTALWHVLRQQSPMSREKLRAHGELLAIVCTAFLGEIEASARDKRRAAELQVLNAAARGLATANSDEAIGTIALETAGQLLPADHIRVLLVGADGSAHVVAEGHDAGVVLEPSRNHDAPVAMSLLRIPLGVGDRAPLGWIEIGSVERDRAMVAPTELTAFASQVAIALANRRASAEVERQRAALERANRFKDEFLATVSHELRTPLNAILGWTQIVRRGQVTGEKLDRALATIERNARAQERLVGDLLDVSRIITGKIRLEAQPIELKSVLTGALDALRPAIDARHQKLVAVLGQADCPVYGDPARLQQIVWNLLSNAVKFTPEGGTVEVDVTRDDDSVDIAVSDTGIGISPAFLPHVFEPFRQADGSTTRTHGGLGLGLAIVRHLTELHGGTITVQSPGRRGGATFVVRLPLSEVESDRPRARERSEAESLPGERPPLAGLYIVLIDDNADARTMTAHVIESAGATVASFESGDEAIESFATRIPDVIVSDIAMPTIDGYALLRRVRRLAENEGGRVPAVALTARAQSDDRVRALRAGFQVHVTKPVESNELIAAIASLAGRFEEVLT